MAGIYIHIPFCKQACHYCNFHFSTSLQYKNEFIQALLAEIRLRKSEFDGQMIETIYFGGGTPGLLSVPELDSILQVIRENYNCQNVLETTVEMNPDDVTIDKITGYKKLGVDRISLGVQSFYKEDLDYMNRSHSAEKALESIDIIHEHFKNYTVDLIYGYPLLSDEKLASNVAQLIKKGTPHISIYGMTVEPKTVLDSFIKKGIEKSMVPAQGAKQFEYLMTELAANDFEHYEISSYAKNGFRAVHNSNYWAGKSYLGFGAGAHSFRGITRSWNIANNALYIKSLSKNQLNQEIETLSQKDILNEIVLLGLRVIEGIDLERYERAASKEAYESLLLKANEHIKRGLLEKSETQLWLTTNGRLFCDGVSADLFV